MRIVTLEEHFSVPELLKGRPDLTKDWAWTPQRLKDDLADLGDRRLADMDKGEVSVQVLSATMPGADLMDGDEGIRYARAANDRLAEAVRQHPNRFAGFAHLPMRSPEAAADELERAVTLLGFRGAMINGTTQDLFLDDPRFAPILACAVRLAVPIYIHPNLPPKAVYDAYYDRLPGMAGFVLATGAFGWHAEVGIHVLRMVFAGTFDQHPGLKVIIGHMGEMLPFMLERADFCARGMSHMRPPSQTILDHVYITTAGVFSTSAFLSALTSFGADRILYSVDYPYADVVPAKRWIDSVPLSPADRVKILHANADRLLKLDAVG
jgi:predicted TIM-barrel fold metal-dependent hydrolase